MVIIFPGLLRLNNEKSLNNLTNVVAVKEQRVRMEEDGIELRAEDGLILVKMIEEYW